MDIIETNSMDNLYEQQKSKAAKHRFYYHYTDIESLNSILLSRSIKLSRLDSVNDLYEAERVKDELRRYSTFVSCFTYSASESIPLWLLYGRNKYGIRIGFDQTCFKGKFYYYKSGKGQNLRLDTSGWEAWDEALIDIVYTDEKMVDVLHPLDNEVEVHYAKHPGMIKSRAWEFEKETRLRTSIRRKMLRNRNLNINLVLSNKPTFESMYYRLDDKCFEMMNITFNPWMKADFGKTIEDMVQKTIPSFDPQNFIYSKLTGQIRNY